MGEVAAVMREIWIRRQDHPAIEDELTGVGISGGATPLAAERAAVVVKNTVLEASARARRRAICSVTNLISAGPSAGAAAGALSSIEPYIAHTPPVVHSFAAKVTAKLLSR